MTQAITITIGLACASAAFGDSSLPRGNWDAPTCKEARAPKPKPPVDDEPGAHPVRAAVRKTTMAPVVVTAGAAVAPEARRVLPVQTEKREARAELSDPLDFVDDTIDSGDISSRLVRGVSIKIEPPPKGPKK
jgi:hypothetical protein